MSALLWIMQGVAGAAELATTGQSMPEWLIGEWTSDELYVLDATPQSLRSVRETRETYLRTVLVLGQSKYAAGSQNLMDIYYYDLRARDQKVDVARLVHARVATLADAHALRIALPRTAEAVQVQSGRCYARGISNRLSPCPDLVLFRLPGRDGFFSYRDDDQTLSHYSRTADVPRDLPDYTDASPPPPLPSR